MTSVQKPASGKSEYRYFLLNKPFGVISQFSPEGDKQTLKEFGPFPKDVYPVGRLDADSEGLLLLTNDNDVKHRLTDPKYEHQRTYTVQIEGIPSDEAIRRLSTGIVIEGKVTRPATVRRLDGEPDFPPRSIPIRARKSIPTSWIEMTLKEGRNRQIRKMTAAVGHPTLRLIRTAIGDLRIEDLKPGESRELTQVEVVALTGRNVIQ